MFSFNPSLSTILLSLILRWQKWMLVKYFTLTDTRCWAVSAYSCFLIAGRAGMLWLSLECDQSDCRLLLMLPTVLLPATVLSVLQLVVQSRYKGQEYAMHTGAPHSLKQTSATNNILQLLLRTMSVNTYVCRFLFTTLSLLLQTEKHVSRSSWN